MGPWQRIIIATISVGIISTIVVDDGLDDIRRSSNGTDHMDGTGASEICALILIICTMDTAFL